MIFAFILLSLWAVGVSAIAFILAKRVLQLDTFIQELNVIASDFGSFLKAKTTRGALVDTPEVREFHNKTVDFLATMEQWADSVSKGEPIKHQSNADLMGSDPKDN